jgi:hypothetical protein
VLSNIQIPVITRFATYAIMLLSLKEHKKAILGTVTTGDFITGRARADRAKRATAVEAGPVHEDIQEAEDALDEGSTLCDMCACPEELAGRFRSAYGNATSPQFWSAAEVRAPLNLGPSK